MFDSTVAVERSHTYPEIFAEGYDFLRDSIDDWTRELEDDEMVIWAPDSIDASATA